MGLYLGGLVIGRIFASEIWRSHFREGLLLLLFFFFWGGGAYYRNFTVFFSLNKVTVKSKEQSPDITNLNITESSL